VPRAFARTEPGKPEAAARFFSEGYRGVRISRTGKRFLIERATVWNVPNEAGQPRRASRRLY